MPGKVDETKWEKAKEQVRKQKGHEPKGDDFALVNYIYQQMGGKFKKKKSDFVNELRVLAEMFEKRLAN